MPASRPDEDHPPEPGPEPELGREEEEAAGMVERSMARMAGLRSWVYRRPGAARLWRLGIALIGLIVVITGVALLVLPGPGWLIIFVGLGIWATEFAWAKSLLLSVQRTVRKWTAWIRRQPRWAIVLWAGIGLIVLAAIATGVWLLSR